MSPDMDSHIDKQMRGPSMVVWLSAGTVIVFLVWAFFAWVDEIVRAEGSMISSSRPQIIQNLEGGILADLNVGEGDIVEAGDILARLHNTKFQSAVDDFQDQISGFEIRRLRLEAEIDGGYAFYVPDQWSVRTPDIVASEAALLQARQSDYVTSVDGAQQVLAEAQRERDLMDALLKNKIVSLIEATRARKAYADAKIKYDDVVTGTQLERAQEYSDVLKELSTLRQNLKASTDQLDRTLLRAPMRGIVNNLSVTTIGGVVRPGEEILQIIPLDEELFVEARVKPEDIAGVRRGQAATVKLSAYDYTIYGTLKGEVKLISADTFKDERARDPDGDPHYKVTLAVDTEHLTERQAALEIRPGMQASVELHTGSKTVLQYLLKPLYKSKEAFREP
ncbi:HlyD family type I secretion periplasmic adaptor subunit [Sulfitobacter guttiformis]|uniref:Membrane fusion protein (MFP) family protein n=1 Tax=Sulfitobacter guttiformis TaxID=74349 RepID=A0A420DK32_9RHOB|nr:HlyD family type I secretion periplasmic adaptor subunit [Sulfitobacter guttiformis]KIN71578.1 Type I secretion membrane fusion protein, HlyD [Sulfitobacter guttiformis KCTC 32187]RKE94587.1 adhesin transport system membrane fusion protein [Sulfitobacter guttiformis]